MLRTGILRRKKDSPIKLKSNLNGLLTHGLKIPLHTDRIKLFDESERLLAADERGHSMALNEVQDILHYSWFAV